MLVGALGATILPPRGVVLSLLVVGVVFAIVLWRTLVHVHARLQAALRDTLAGLPEAGDTATRGPD
jgi:CPA2 family monovalent cation:H+ antiporter-2